MEEPRGEDDPESEQPGWAEAAAAAVIGPDGEVTCPLPPWGGKGAIGSIKAWDPNPAKLNVNCKCWVHAGCSTPPRKRAYATDEMLLSWLFAGKYADPRITPAGEQYRLGNEHMKMYAEMADGFRFRDRGAGAASSSIG